MQIHVKVAVIHSQTEVYVYMEWLIIGLVLAFLVSSVMWVMPSPRQRHQGVLRMRARQLGIQVQLAHLSLPRAKGEVDAETVIVPAYRFVRQNLSRSERDGWREWQVHRMDTINNEGLPDGWSWIKGEGCLSSTAFAQLEGLLKALPEDVVGVESTPLYLSLYWHERGDAAQLGWLHAQIQPLLENKL